MPRFIYRFTGEAAEHFLFLPADPPSQVLQPGDRVTCREPVEHARLELVDETPRKAAAPRKAPADNLKEVTSPDAAR